VALCRSDEVAGSCFAGLELRSFDLASLCPPGWQDEISTCCMHFGAERLLDGSSSTSREPRLTGLWARPMFHLVNGNDVARQLPWLAGVYQKEILQLARLNYGDVFCSMDPRAGVNINMQPSGCRYEWHVDCNPLTAVLFVTSHGKDDGGALVLRPDTGREVTTRTADYELKIQPVSGKLVFFRGQQYAHHVEAVLSKYRICVPMNFFTSEVSQERADVDEYLY
jgi:hypothetical protein